MCVFVVGVCVCVGVEWEVLPFAKKDVLVQVKVGLSIQCVMSFPGVAQHKPPPSRKSCTKQG